MAKRKPAGTPSIVSAPRSTAERPPVWDLLLVALVLCRFLVPAEGVDQGHTLWIAAAWLALGAGRAWSLWRNGQGFSQTFSLVDAGVAALVAGHCLSALLVMTGEGDRRAALNCCWEWVSIGVMWLLLKESLQRIESRRLICWCLIVTVITLSGFGIWQHYIWYPQQSRDLVQLLDFQKEIDAGQVLAPPERASYERLLAEYGTDFLTLEEGSRQSLLARTRDSREPIGRFALANSFAALLILGWFAVLDLLRYLHQRRFATFALSIVGLAAILIFICLMLTKSRTALVGICVSLSWLAVRLAIRPGPQRQMILQRAGWGLGMVAGLAIVLSLAGGLDWQVLSEAPKSLSYRQEYWHSTWKMIQSHFLFGVGPGNFRQHYFAEKLAGASEEILDPHNMLLDAWANGGLLALGGLLVLIALWIWRLWSSPIVFDEDATGRPSLFHAGCLVGACSFGLTLSEEWLLEGFFDSTLACLGLAWIGIHLCLNAVTFKAQTNFYSGLSIPASLAAGTAILIHLLGAGGIGMPAILQLILLLFLLASPPPPFLQTRPSIGMPIASGVTAILFMLCLWTGLVPVVTVARLMEQGRHESLVEHRLIVAEKYFQEAAKSDRLAASPHDELAAIYFERWMRAGQDDEELFNSAISEKAEALGRNPLAAKEYLTLSGWWLRRFERNRQAEFASTAVAEARKGTSLYPNFVPMQAQLAFSLDAANQPEEAAAIAQRALELDDLNLCRGHVDKALPQKDRDRLQQLAGN